MDSILHTIASRLHPALTEEKRRIPAGVLEALCGELPPSGRDFTAALRRSDGRIRAIAELKKASPSKGMIRPGLNAAILAADLAGAGAAALSVLTEPNYFLGSRENLLAARAASPDTPILRKDFIFDEYQLLQAKLWGADAVLLIVSLLSATELKRLFDFATSLDLAVLVETHDRAEIETALSVGAGIIGVNARNLADFSTDATRASELISILPAGVVKVAESAIDTPARLAAAEAVGADACLIGEALMRASDPAEALRRLYGR
ncbi:MAG: indole-3-glycerol phosphate synthase TrpC [Victivallaceae bacterium]|nr:indole-3-glycerol phosphate synthase TrpC [Victivallaceae bacterium]